MVLEVLLENPLENGYIALVVEEETGFGESCEHLVDVVDVVDQFLELLFEGEEESVTVSVVLLAEVEESYFGDDVFDVVDDVLVVQQLGVVLGGQDVLDLLVLAVHLLGQALGSEETAVEPF